MEEGKTLVEIIVNLREEKQNLECKILEFYTKYKDADDVGPYLMNAFKDTFGIEVHTEGLISKEDIDNIIVIERDENSKPLMSNQFIIFDASEENPNILKFKKDNLEVYNELYNIIKFQIENELEKQRKINGEGN